jgi:uncharacterized protein (TIGR03066 family)
MGEVGDAGREPRSGARAARTVTPGWRLGGPAYLSWGKENGMKWHRFAVAGALVLGLTLVGTAVGGGGDNAKKIVGEWELTKSSSKKGAPLGTKILFAKDGKLKISFKVMDKDFSFGGTYKVEGKKLKTTISVMGMEKSDTDTIKTLTDDRLVLEDDKGISTEFKRVGEKKKTD